MAACNSVALIVPKESSHRPADIKVWRTWWKSQVVDDLAGISKVSSGPIFNLPSLASFVISVSIKVR